MNEPYPDFAAASQAVIDFLKAEVPMGLWMVTRTDGHRWIALQVADRGYGARPGDVLPYAESLCAQRLACQAPDIAPDVDQVDAYRDAPARRRAPIGAYISFPLLLEDGAVFGTLCALDPAPRPADMLRHRSLLALLARQLATILHVELAREGAWREAALARAAAETDPLTGCLNRRGWEQHCEREEARCRDLGSALSVLVIDLDDFKTINDRGGHAAGDRLLRATADRIRDVIGPAGILARTGGDEFAILLPNLAAAGAEQLAGRLRAMLEAGAIAASLGVAERKPYRGLDEAWQRADRRMYDDKERRRRGGLEGRLP
jgi:diguanylate cyclase (GGDEF)-like protein